MVGIVDLDFEFPKSSISVREMHETSGHTEDTIRDWTACEEIPDLIQQRAQSDPGCRQKQIGSHWSYFSPPTGERMDGRPKKDSGWKHDKHIYRQEVANGIHA